MRRRSLNEWNCGLIASGRVAGGGQVFSVSNKSTSSNIRKHESAVAFKAIYKSAEAKHIQSDNGTVLNWEGEPV